MRIKLPTNIVELIKALMTQRTLYVIDPYTRNLVGPGQANLGLAQGSPISAVLFKIFVADLNTHINIEGVKVIKYADDTTLISTGSTIQIAQDKMNQALHKLELWAGLKGLSISPEKSKAIHFRKKNVQSTLTPLKFFFELFSI